MGSYTNVATCSGFENLLLERSEKGSDARGSLLKLLFFVVCRFCFCDTVRLTYSTVHGVSNYLNAHVNTITIRSLSLSDLNFE